MKKDDGGWEGGERERGRGRGKGKKGKMKGRASWRRGQVVAAGKHGNRRNAHAENTTRCC
jgi:hypothetical protein